MTDFTDDKDEYFEEMGTCCFCGDYCNPCSQSCGSCSREKTGIMLGWIKPKYLRQNIVFHNKSYTPEKFRNIIRANKYDFDKPLFLNPMTCDISLLVNWAGASLE